MHALAEKNAIVENVFVQKGRLIVMESAKSAAMTVIVMTATPARVIPVITVCALL